MTLSENIVRLRAEHHLSQGDLAEKTGVSRQSISKWETGASTPELEKLLLLAELFEVSLDELVGREAADQKPSLSAAPGPIAEPDRALPRIFGAVLLAGGLLSVILGILLLPPLLFLGVYCFLCGVLCLVLRRNIGLTIAWVTVLPLVLLSFWFEYVLRTEMAALLRVLCWVGLALTVWRTIHKQRRGAVEGEA